MKCSKKSILYGQEKIFFDIFHLERKTMEIAVHPDKSVVVKAPLTSSSEEVIQKVARRAGWIKRQQLYFEQFHPRTPPRRYVGGETHLYLGRGYRLKIKELEQTRVFLQNGYLNIETSDISSDNIQKLLEKWYFKKAKAYFLMVFLFCWEKFEKNQLTQPQLKIQKMKARWGSLSKNGRLTLNLDLIKVPRTCIEYVIIHELCHLVHYDHGKDFYRLLSHLLPDWIYKKRKLENLLS